MKPHNQMEAFRPTVEECGMSDLGFVGNKFTQCNNRHGEASTKKRLDRAFSNNEWNELFPRTIVSTLPTQNSDHSTILLSMDNSLINMSSMTKPFRYVAWWVQREECNKIIQGKGKNSRMADNKLRYTTKRLRKCQAVDEME